MTIVAVSSTAARAATSRPVVPGAAEVRRDSLAHPATAGGPSSADTAGPYRVPPLRGALFADMHNKLVHFPIVLTFVAALMLVLARRKPELEPVAFWLVWAAALSALAAYFSGVFAEGEFEKDPKHWLAELHRKWGIAVGIAQAVWVLLLLRPSTRRFAWAWGLIVVTLVSCAALIGGLVAHGE